MTTENCGRDNPGHLTNHHKSMVQAVSVAMFSKGVVSIPQHVCHHLETVVVTVTFTEPKLCGSVAQWKSHYISFGKPPQAAVNKEIRPQLCKSVGVLFGVHQTRKSGSRPQWAFPGSRSANWRPCSRRSNGARPRAAGLRGRRALGTDSSWLAMAK